MLRIFPVRKWWRKLSKLKDREEPVYIKYSNKGKPDLPPMAVKDFLRANNIFIMKKISVISELRRLAYNVGTHFEYHEYRMSKLGNQSEMLLRMRKHKLLWQWFGVAWLVLSIFRTYWVFFLMLNFIWESNHGRANHLGGNDKLASRNINPQWRTLPVCDMLSSKIVIVLFTSRAEFNLISFFLQSEEGAGAKCGTAQICQHHSV